MEAASHLWHILRKEANLKKSNKYRGDNLESERERESERGESE